MPPWLAQQCNPAMSPDTKGKEQAHVTLKNISGEKPTKPRGRAGGEENGWKYLAGRETDRAEFCLPRDIYLHVSDWFGLDPCLSKLHYKITYQTSTTFFQYCHVKQTQTTVSQSFLHWVLSTGFTVVNISLHKLNISFNDIQISSIATCSFPVRYLICPPNFA